ncbi:MAG TPA: nucleotidyltransferase domain-containing protein [Candidatus Lokiarchaeia archaeon]
MKIYLKDLLKKFEKINSIVLFGSYAKGNFDKRSDIDLCIILKENSDRNNEIKIHEYILELSKELNVIIEGVYIYLDNLNRWDPSFIINIINEGILIVGFQNYENIFKTYIKKELLKFNFS